MPTLTASTPASARARTPPAVATLPAMRSTDGNACRSRAAASITFWECPCALSRTSTSTLAATSASARSRASAAMPTAAPTRRRPSESLHALGYLIAFWMSLTVIRPRRLNCWSTTRSFSTRCRCRMSFACASVVPTGTVMSFSRVITSEMGRWTSPWNRRSRFVSIPTRRPSLRPSAVIGTPEIRYFRINSSACETRASGESVIGLTIIPLSERFTRSTSDACAWTSRFLWTIPMPPSCAIAIAIRDSVTVSMAALRSGRFRGMRRVKRVPTSTSRGREAEWRGRSRTSSNVNAVSTVALVSRSVDVSILTVMLHPPFTPRNTSCTSCRCRMDTAGCVRPSARCGVPS